MASLAKVVFDAVSAITTILFPSVCPICGSLLTENEPICRNCRAHLDDIRLPLPHFTVDDHAFDEVFAPYRYQGVAKDIVHLYKYQGVTALNRFIAEEIAELIDGEFDFVIWVPLHKARRRERGFSQTEKLAKKLAELIGVPPLSALVRIRYTKPQVSIKTGQKRKLNVKHAFDVRKELVEAVKGKRVLLVDDVMTTGSTMDEAARPLKDLDCSISAAVFAVAG